MSGGNGKFGKGNRAAVGHGRPKINEEFRQKARKAVDEKVLQAWIDELEERERTVITPAGPFEIVQRGKEWMRASENLAAYGYGKPVQPSESRVEVDMTVRNAREMTRDQLMAIAAGEQQAAETEH